ncbi:hypothetical protein Leryth_017231, partial [Lithospermum erythrorhizon]
TPHSTTPPSTTAVVVTTSTTTATASPPPLTELLSTTTTNQGGTSLAPKRQRRPSVRLGDIGGELTSDHSNFRRPKSSWRYHKDPSVAIKNSKSRPLTNLVNNKNTKNGSFLGGFDFVDSYDHHGQSQRNDPNAELSHKKLKTKMPIKRARTNWKFEGTSAPSNGGLGVLELEKDVDFRDGNGDNDNDKDFRELEAEDSESPVNSRESLDVITGVGFRDRRRISGGGIWESSRGCNEINGTEHNNGDEIRSSSIKDWLIGLGLGRYAPVFEIHEVDDEVLAMLTMEDLKDMGVNAVGSRRKMYTAIEKLRKEFPLELVTY